MAKGLEANPLRWTALGTAWCIAAMVFLDQLLAGNPGVTALGQRFFNMAVLPLVVAAPLFAVLTLKLRELSAANQKLGLVASMDSLTACLNRAAFSAEVDERLAVEIKNRRRVKGALLIVDADHFKAINDTYGHDQGDEALRAIATAIRGAVRKGDLVGRLGGEEFGVFLPGASKHNAVGVADRIRRAISDVIFRPNGAEHRLSVSVGGVSFEDQIGFVELFRIADQRLYRAKKGGRNRIELTHVEAYEPEDVPSLH